MCSQFSKFHRRYPGRGGKEERGRRHLGGKNKLKGCLHDTGATFAPERVYFGSLSWLCICLHDTTTKLLLYNASIKPLFTYCCIVWSKCSQTNLDELFKLQKRCARLILDSPRDARSYDNFQKLKWLPVDQLFKLNKIGLLKKVIDGRAPEYLITTLDSLRFEHKYSTRTKTLYRLPKPRTEAMRRTFFYSTIKELNALNLEPTTSFSLIKTTLTNNVVSNYTVDNLKVKKLF